MIFNRAFDELDISDIEELKQRGETESLFIEYKSDFPDSKDIAKTVASFANTHGGYLLVGVKADKLHNAILDIPGIEKQDGLKEQINNAVVGNLQPIPLLLTKVIPLADRSDRCVLLTHVEESVIPPHIMTGTGIIYVRTPQSSDPIDRVKDRYTLERLYGKGERVKGELSAIFEERKRIGTPPLEGVAWACQVLAIPQIYNAIMVQDLFTRDRAEWFAKHVVGLTGRGSRSWPVDTMSQDSIIMKLLDGETYALTRAGVVHHWLHSNNDRDPIPGRMLMEQIKTVLDLAAMVYAGIDFAGQMQIHVLLQMPLITQLVWGMDRSRGPDIHMGEQGATGEREFEIVRESNAHDLKDKIPIIVEDIGKELRRCFGIVVYD